MLLIRCPYCEEERPELEFRHAGEAHLARSGELATISDDDFEGYFFIRSNVKGTLYERWRHVHGCGRFFNAVRDSVTDKFFMTYKAGEPRPDIKLAPRKHIDDGRGDRPADEGPGAYANVAPADLNVKKPASKRGTKKGEA